MTDPLPKDLVALRQASGWVAAIAFQGGRLEQLLAAQTALPRDPRAWTREQVLAHNAANDLGEGRLTEYYESFFFLISVCQARRWLPRVGMKRIDPEGKAAIVAFNGLTSEATDVRDMIVHEDEYLFGRGNKAAQYRFLFKNRLEVSAHSLVVQGDDYLVGGRLSVPKTLAIARLLLPLLDAAARRREAEVTANPKA